MDACRALDGSAPPHRPAARQARPHPARRASMFSECLLLKKYNFVGIKCQGLQTAASNTRCHRNAGRKSTPTRQWHRMTASLSEGQVNALQKRRETQWPNDERHLPGERRGEGSYGLSCDACGAAPVADHESLARQGTGAASLARHRRHRKSVTNP